MKLGVRVRGVRNREEGEVSSEGNVIVADGGGAMWRDFCRFPSGIFGELWEDLTYHLRFTINIGDVFM